MKKLLLMAIARRPRRLREVRQARRQGARSRTRSSTFITVDEVDAQHRQGRGAGGRREQRDDAQARGRGPRRGAAHRLGELRAHRAAGRQGEGAGVLLREHAAAARRTSAAHKAIAAGYSNVKVMPEGIAGWVKAGKKVQSDLSQRRAQAIDELGLRDDAERLAQAIDVRARLQDLAGARRRVLDRRAVAAQLDDRARELEHGDLAAGADVRDARASCRRASAAAIARTTSPT